MTILFAGGDLGWEGLAAVGLWLLLILAVVTAVFFFGIRWLERKIRKRNNQSMAGREPTDSDDKE